MIDNLKPYSAYKASGMPWLGQIPKHWDTKRAKYFFREADDRSVTGDEELLSVSHITGVTPRSQKNITMFLAESNVGHKLCQPDDIVINTMWAWMAALGVARQCGVVSPSYAVYRPIANNGILPQYVDHLLRTPAYAAEYLCASTGINTSRLRLYPEQFLRIAILRPPQDEQALIVRFVAHADSSVRRYIRSKKSLIALLNEEKRAIIHRAVTRGLDPHVCLKPSGVKWLGDVPEHWEVWQVGHFGRVGNGSTPSRGNSAYWAGGTYPWLNSSSVNRSPISGSDQFVTDIALKECHLPRVQPSSVLIAITGQGKTRGTAAVLTIEATINQHIAYVTPRRSVVSAEYLQLVLVAAYRELRSISDDSGSTKGALTCADVAKFKIALPTLQEQTAIISAVRTATQSLEAALNRTEREIELLLEYRMRLIADVVTGKIDVRDVAALLPDESGAFTPEQDPLAEDGDESDSADLDDMNGQANA